MNDFVETLKQLGPARLGILGAVALGLLLFFAFISMRVAVPEMHLLYADLSTLDSSAVAAKLETEEIPYQTSPDGSTISVAEDQIGRARMLLAAAGLPNGGSLGYEIFDKSSGFGTTNFVQNINQVRALEGELARTIVSVEGIRSARIHLVLPQRELFSREQRSATASVFLGINSGLQIDNEKIRAIQSLVSSAVPELKAENVSVIDNNGNLLASSEGSDGNQIGAKAEERRLGHENHLIQKIEAQLNSVVGYGKVRATVTAEMNFDRISTNEELYDPSGQVVRSTQVTEENSLERKTGGDGNVSVDNNLPAVGVDLLSDVKPAAEDNRVEEVTNYEISKTIRSTVREVGEIKRLSVAVLVDGRYKRDEDGNKIYEPRPEEELNQIATLVKSAVGFNEERGDQVDIVNLQFAQIDTNEDAIDAGLILGFDRNKLLDVAEILTVAIMIILVIILILQPMVNKLLETQPVRELDTIDTDLLGAAPVPAALTGPAGPNGEMAPMLGGPAMGHGQSEEPNQLEETLINIHGVEGKVKASSVKKIEEIVENYPKETLSVIRDWMGQE